MIADVMEAFDCLPLHQRIFINNCDYNLIDEHILGGPKEMARVMALINGGTKPYFLNNGTN